MKKVVRLGESNLGDIFCIIELENKKGKGLVLSISGAEAPLCNGDCKGGYAQIPEYIRDKINSGKFKFAPNWNKELVLKFLDIWERWHTNDLRAACEHQRAANWGKETIIIRKYKLTPEAIRQRVSIEEKVKDMVKKTGKAEITEEERAIFNLEHRIYELAYDSLPENKKRFYKLDTEEKRLSGWVPYTTHPEGVLNKPCPVCGYKYGSAWLFEEIPAEVIDFLVNLPEADKKYPWGNY